MIFRTTLFLTTLSTCLLGTLLAVAAPASDRPNILWISCEDISPHLGCYGSPDAITPTLDELATRGVRYTHAFTTTPVCATNRSSIITGMYPTTIGTQYMRCRAQLPDYARCFTEYLRDAGYYCTNNSKEDYNFAPPDSAWDESNGRAHWRHRQDGQPFFAVFNFTLSHESKVWPRGEDHLKLSKDLTPDDFQDPNQVTLPPYYPDTPEVRRDWANYLENITQIDYQADHILKQLEEDGLLDDTIVFFWSDHGAGLPRAKRWPYDSGTRVPLIVHVPERYRPENQARPNSVSDELISFIDLAPTVLNLAGLEIPEHLQGRAFLGSNLSAPREYVFNVRDRMDSRYDMIRAVRDHRYRYIRNYRPWKPYAQYLSYGEVNQTMQALRRAKADGTLPEEAELFMSDRKPVEEFYDCTKDPHQVVNLAESSHPEHQRAMKRMRRRLAEWEIETRDLGLIPEPIVRRREARHGESVSILGEPGARDALAQIRQMIAPGIDSGRQAELARQGLSSDDPTVRHWAINTLTHLPASDEGAASGRSRRDVSEHVRPLLDDGDALVRITAANSLCRTGHADLALPVLLAGLAHESPWVRLYAANYVDELAPQDPRAIAALEQLSERDAGDYGQRVAERALHRIDGREMPNRWGNN